MLHNKSTPCRKKSDDLEGAKERVYLVLSGEGPQSADLGPSVEPEESGGVEGGVDGLHLQTESCEGLRPHLPQTHALPRHLQLSGAQDVLGVGGEESDLSLPLPHPFHHHLFRLRRASQPCYRVVRHTQVLTREIRHVCNGLFPTLSLPFTRPQLLTGSLANCLLDNCLAQNANCKET